MFLTHNAIAQAVLFKFWGGGVEWDWVHLVRWPLFGQLYQPWSSHVEQPCGAVGEMRNGEENRSTHRKTGLSATLSATNLTWPEPGSNLGRCGGKPATAWGMTLPAQAVSRWFPNSKAFVRAQVRSYGICGGQSGTGAGFLRVLQFLLPILIPPIAPHSSLSSGTGIIGPTLAGEPSGLSLTSSTETTVWGSRW
jgi:hypothetical protein